MEEELDYYNQKTDTPMDELKDATFEYRAVAEKRQNSCAGPAPDGSKKTTKAVKSLKALRSLRSQRNRSAPDATKQ